MRDKQFSDAATMLCMYESPVCVPLFPIYKEIAKEILNSDDDGLLAILRKMLLKLVNNFDAVTIRS